MSILYTQHKQIVSLIVFNEQQKDTRLCYRMSKFLGEEMSMPSIQSKRQIPPTQRIDGGTIRRATPFTVDRHLPNHPVWELPL